MAATEPLNYLQVAVTQEKIPVTYRLLSRKTHINVNAAKKLLYQFVSTTEHNVTATYCITGEALTHISGNEPTQTIRLVDAEDLEEARKQFNIVTGIHVYSVQPSRLKDHSLLVTANSDIPKCSLSDLKWLGLIKDNSITISESKHPAPTAASQAKPVASKPAVNKPVETSAAPKPAPSKQENAKKEKSEKNSVASLFGSANANKTKPKAKPAPHSPAKAAVKPQPPSAPSTPRKTKKIQSDSEDEEEDEEEMDRRLAASSRQAQSAEDFWKDDEETMDQSKSAAAKQEEIETSTPQSNQVEDTDNTEKEEAEAATPTEETASDATRERRRVKRKVLKKKHYKDEKGFLVTEDVYEWESHSEDEVTEPVLKRKAPPVSPSKTDSKKTARKGGPADQKSLLSFWGKK